MSAETAKPTGLSRRRFIAAGGAIWRRYKGKKA